MSYSRALRKITRSATRYYRNLGTWPTVARVASEHDDLNPVDIGWIASGSDSIRVVAGRVVVIEELAVPDEEQVDRDGLPRHLALLHDLQRVSLDQPPVYNDGRVPLMPKAVNGGRSRNMALMQLAISRATRRPRDADLELEKFTDHERSRGLQSQEILSEYQPWSLLPLAMMVSDKAFSAHFLTDHVRREIALWRVCSLDRIVVFRNGRPVYVGMGCRTAGTRKLPKSIVDMSNGVADVVCSYFVGLEPEVNRWRGTSESLDDDKGVEAEIAETLKPNIFELFSELADLDAAVELLKRDNVRTMVPLVIERYHDGSVATWIEENASMQTGATWFCYQWVNGRVYSELFPYPVERVRKGHSWLKRGRAYVENQDRVLVVDPVGEGKHAHIATVQLSPESEVALRLRLSPEGCEVTRRSLTRNI